MNGCFRTLWMMILVALFLADPGLLSIDSDGCSHAAGTPHPARILLDSDPLNTSPPPAGRDVTPHSSIGVARVYAVQVSACREEKNACAAVEGLRGKGYTPEIYPWKDHSGTSWHSVFLGVYGDASEAELVARGYRQAEGRPVFVKTLERLRPREVTTTGKSTDPLQGEAVASDGHEGAPTEPQEVCHEGPEMAQEEEFGPEFTYSGFIDFQSFVNTGTSGSFRERNKKNEIRNRLQVRYGTDNLYLFSVSNMYWFQTYLNKRAIDHYRYAKDQQVSRNLRLSSQEAELAFDELYLNYGRKNFRLRAGNQIYGWGTADAFNPTSYFNPSDMREMVFRDDDQNKAGVPSLSGMFFLGDYTLEAVFVPVHIPPIMPPEGNFWGFSVNRFSLPIIFDEPERLSGDSANVGYGARLSTSRGGVDMSFSGYRGPDTNQLFLPSNIIYQGATPVALRVKSQASIVSMFGFDISTALGDFVMQFEAAYSPDKAGVVEQNITSIAGLRLPFEIDRSHFLSYAAGFNYFVPMDRLIEGHTGEAVFTFEWFKSRYLEDGLYAPYITDIVTCKFEDSYLDGRIKATVKGIFDMKHGGKILWPEIGYDFQNGFFVDVGYAAIWMEKGSTWENASIFYYFKDSDMLMGKIRYQY